MSDSNGFWSRQLSRRSALRAAAVLGAGGAALSLVGCGSSSKGGTNGSSRSGQAVDSAKGIPGGSFVMQNQGFRQTLVMVQDTSTITSGFAHAGLMELKGGRPIVGPYSTELDPELAVAMPEQPDELSYVFKLADARFQNGRTVTSEDVAYSLDRFANWTSSGGKASYAWLDKVETPDAKTAVVKSKVPFADALLQMSNFQTMVLAKEFEESPEASKRYMGAGPFIFVDYEAPVQMRFKKNPDFFQKPYPYFDEVVVLGGQDDAAKVATFISRQVHVPWGYTNPDLAKQVEQGRPDAAKSQILFASHAAHYRVDRAPFNDKRVRQALSMGIDRKKIRESYSGGAGEDDTILSWIIEGFSFRKPKDLGAPGKFWSYDPQAAKQLLSAAGVTSALKANFYHADASFLGQGFVDHATLSMATWRENGLADFTDVSQPLSQIGAGANIGNFEGLYLWPSGLANQPIFAINMKAFFYAPPSGVTSPTTNSSFVNNPQLNQALDKQQSQLNKQERQATLKGVEEILAEEQYWNTYSTYPSAEFHDPRLRNIQVPKFWFGGMHGSAKYWWFDK